MPSSKGWRRSSMWGMNAPAIATLNDSIFKSICVFFDRVERRCGVYDARPYVCRKYPWGKHCGYYDFIKFEREMIRDDEFIPFPYPKS